MNDEAQLNQSMDEFIENILKNGKFFIKIIHVLTRAIFQSSEANCSNLINEKCFSECFQKASACRYKILVRSGCTVGQTYPDYEVISL